VWGGEGSFFTARKDYRSLVKNSPFCSYQPFNKLTPCPPLFPREGGTSSLATIYPLYRIERGTRGELRKTINIRQLFLTYSPDFYTDNGE
jgi:hypothetical protein